MYNFQIKSFFHDKENIPSPITMRLLKAGYRQKTGGYVSYAKQLGIENPSQYWHLIESWCNRSRDNAPFNRTIQCGELIVWMAEVSNAVDDALLNELVNLIISQYLNNRRAGNRIIQDQCFSKVKAIVTEAYNPNIGQV